LSVEFRKTARSAYPELGRSNAGLLLASVVYSRPHEASLGARLQAPNLV